MKMNGFYVWNLQEDILKYEYYIKKCNNITPFHLSEYLLAEMRAESGVTKVFCYEEDEEFALIPEVIREINLLPYMCDLKEKIYDMITPHEYGGIVSNSCNDAIKYKLLQFMFDYCTKYNIIFQFVRINPYMKELPLIYKNSGYEVLHSNDQVYVNLNLSEDQIMKDYKANVRYGIRRAERENLKCGIREKSIENIKIFQNGYQKAMDILNASTFLYFNDQYFESLVNCECSKLATVMDANGKTVAASIMLIFQQIAYYHLSWFDREYANKCPMNYLLHFMIMWAKRNGCEVMHIAGGNDRLKKFKSGYSDTRIDYYIANKICNEKKYQTLCCKWRQRFPEYANEQFYPLYRYNE